MFYSLLIASSNLYFYDQKKKKLQTPVDCEICTPRIVFLAKQ